MNAEEYEETYGVEPECDSCIYYVLCSCQLEKDGIECDGRSEFVSDGR